MQKITIIAAMDQNGVIGSKGGLPWHLKEELAHFKRTTLGKTLIMGRKTFESLGSKTLPGRKILVVSRKNLDLKDTLEKSKNEPEIMIAGGAEIYKQCLNFATHLVLSIIEGSFEGDTYFPEVDWQSWSLEHQESHPGFLVKYFSREPPGKRANHLNLDL